MKKNILFIIAFSLINKLTFSTILYPLSKNNAANKLQITNGTKVPQGKYRFYAGIFPEERKVQEQGNYCGASLIAPSWVLTAQHCAWLSDKHKDISGFTVAVGSADFGIAGSYESRIISQVFFTTDKPDEGYAGHDIALLKLDKPITNIKPVLLATFTPVAGTNSIVIGTGVSDISHPAPYEPSKFLLEASIPINFYKFCYNDLSKFYPEQELCVGSNSGARTNALWGDSGGPLVLEINGIYYQTGIVSRPITEDIKTNVPVIYTNISHFLSWINSTIKEQTH